MMLMANNIAIADLYSALEKIMEGGDARAILKDEHREEAQARIRRRINSAVARQCGLSTLRDLYNSSDIQESDKRCVMLFILEKIATSGINSLPQAWGDYRMPPMVDKATTTPDDDPDAADLHSGEPEEEEGCNPGDDDDDAPELPQQELMDMIRTIVREELDRAFKAIQGHDIHEQGK